MALFQPFPYSHIELGVRHCSIKSIGLLHNHEVHQCILPHLHQLWWGKRDDHYFMLGRKCTNLFSKIVVLTCMLFCCTMAVLPGKYISKDYSSQLFKMKSMFHDFCEFQLSPLTTAYHLLKSSNLNKKSATMWQI